MKYGRKFMAGLLVLCLMIGMGSPAKADDSAGDAFFFEDVDVTQWYFPAIAYCVGEGYMKGLSETAFVPFGTVTRAQMVQVLYNLSGRPDTEGLENPFTDVEETDWYADAVKWGRQQGVVNGLTETLFAPNNPVTREQVATMFMRYHQYSGGESLPYDTTWFYRFIDRGFISGWANESLNWAVQYGLLSGIRENILSPMGTCNRAQLAQFINNYFEPPAVTPPEVEDPDAEPPVALPTTSSPLVRYVRRSPNNSGMRRHIIDTITIHCMAGNLSVESCGATFANPAYKASSNYGIGSDGRIALYVDEWNHSWCSSNFANDDRAVTIEVANNGGAPNWPVSLRAYNALLDLVTDICRRNNIQRLLWEGDPTLIGQVERQNMTVHRWFAAKECPGNYLYSRHGAIAAEVNRRLASMRTTSSVFSALTVTDPDGSWAAGQILPSDPSSSLLAPRLLQ